MKNLSSFCTCTDQKCPRHPVNHERGCAPCVAFCLAQREIPSCFFKKADGGKQHASYKFEDFAESVLQENADNEE